jgi:putative ABC transport system substrate-binding protein
MRRREFITLLGGAAIAWPLVARAQQPATRVPRIGFLWATSARGAEDQAEGFRHGLRELGYVEGQNIVVEHRWADGNYERLPEFAAELVRMKMDVIMAAAAPAARAAREATATIPIVMVSVGEVVESGFVPSLARPGGNITGQSSMVTETSSKRLELLKEVLPGLTRVAVLWNAANPLKIHDWKETETAARVLNVTLRSIEVRGPDDFDGAFAAIARDRPDALITLPDPLIRSQRERIVAFANNISMPAMCTAKSYVRAGCLISFGADGHELFRRSAMYMDRILKGATPGDLPVEQPTKFELVINLKTARALGIEIPATVLARADEVIE